MKLSDMRSVKLKIKKFQLQFHQINSKEIFTSFASFEVKLIINEAELVFVTSSEKRPFTNSVFKDEEVRSMI